MKEIIASLLLYLGQFETPQENIVAVDTSINKNQQVIITKHERPEVKQINKKSMVDMMYEGNIPENYDYQLNTTLGLYNHNENIIYIHESVDVNTVFGKSVLLHELVHFNQYKTGKYEVAECLQVNEKLAYTVQNQYLEDNGLNALYNKAHIFFASLCNDYV